MAVKRHSAFGSSHIPAVLKNAPEYMLALQLRIDACIMSPRASAKYLL